MATTPRSEAQDSCSFCHGKLTIVVSRDPDEEVDCVCTERPAAVEPPIFVTDPARMRHPMKCKWCGTVHDTAFVTVVQRYLDCSTWHCPGCGVLIDDRPIGWGGSAERVSTTAASSRRQPDGSIRHADKPPGLTVAEALGLHIDESGRSWR